jgi:hypothetical protein
MSERYVSRTVASRSEARSSETRQTRLHESIKRRRMNIKVIFKPYWILATYALKPSATGWNTMGDVDMKVKSWRRQVKGRGKMRRQNTAISNTRSAKTYRETVSVACCE